ncbi:MAG: hypothetical protein KF802_08360 [Bdellovibrionaceae bacterium]|nr:hypothetical protein [Pseudobdellovibrionaceae bacterium]
MSMKRTGEWFGLAIQEIRRRPLFWFGFGAAQVLVLWSQDLVAYLGTLVASSLSVLLLARQFTPRWRPFARPLLALGLLNFPFTALWLILSSLYENAGWLSAISPLWSLPILFCMCWALWALAFTVARITSGTLSLDEALKGAWRDLRADLPTFFWSSLLLAMMFSLSFYAKGLGFFLSAPLVLAYLKVGLENARAARS